MKIKLPELLLIIAGLLVLLWIAQKPVPAFEELSDKEEIEEDFEQENKLYGILMDSLEAEHFEVKPRQNLSEILGRFGVSMQTVDMIARESEEVFDLRSIRAGNTCSVIRTKDSLRQAQYFVYEKNSKEYVVFDLRDSVKIYPGTKKVDTILQEVSGLIDRSLWVSMHNQEADPYLAIMLSDIYAWAVDFYGIKKGDQYKVIYEQLYVDDKPVALGNIKAAWFKHADRPFYAFYFVQDSVGDYFDEEANSLRREFLKAPLNFSRISSRFSYSRMHPIHRVRRPHLGVDYAAPMGTPVRTVGDGKVIRARYSGGAGHYVKIKHNSVYTTGYMHLSRYGEGIKAGEYVKQGDVIGYVGSTGTSTGPHLDFRFFKNGEALDPLKVESPPAEPVDSAHMKRYFKHMEKWKQKLDQMHAPEHKES